MSFDAKSDFEAILHKIYITLFTCASIRGFVLDVSQRLDTSSFSRTLNKFVIICAYPTCIISDVHKNFVSVETEEFVSQIGIEWKMNL